MRFAYLRAFIDLFDYFLDVSVRLCLSIKF